MQDCVKIANFFAADVHKSMLEFVLSSETKFVGSTIVTENTANRQSKKLKEFPMVDQFLARLAQVMDPVCDALRIARLPGFQWELEIVATEDGGFYRQHTDTGIATAATDVPPPVSEAERSVRQRVLSYVYYLQPEPRCFQGGFLRFHTVEGVTDIEPVGNSIVFFPSGLWHEILPTVVPSRHFADSRFTINGWIKRPPTVNT